MRVIVADAIFDGRESRSTRTAIRVDADGRIAAIGPADGSLGSTAAEVLNCPSDATLLPGLIDLNTKLIRWGRSPAVGWRDEPIVETVLRCRERLGRLLAEGCTYIRDLAASWQLNLQFRDAVAVGRIEGPHIAAAGLPIAALSRASKSYPVLASRSADEARGHVRTLLAEGADVIAVAVTSGAATNGWQQLSECEIAAIVQEAHRAGKRVTATCVGAEGAAAAVAAGVDSIDHGVSIDDRTLGTMAKQRIALVPTLRLLSRFASHPNDYGVPPAAQLRMPELYRTAADTVRRAAAAGVPIATGTDRHTTESIADEVQELTATGLTPPQALTAATSSAARVLGLERDCGSIVVGARADLLLVRGDPARAPQALRDVVWVMKGGVPIQVVGQE